MNIIIVGLQAWDVEIGSNCKNIAMEFSKHHRVLYINSPLDRKTMLLEKNQPSIKFRMNLIKGNEFGLYKINDNLWTYYPKTIIESINLIPFNNLFNFINYVNNKRFSKEIQLAAKQLGFDQFILFNDNDIIRSFYLKELLQPDLSIYYLRDYLPAVDYWKRHGKRLEPYLISKSDLVFTNSIQLKEYAIKYNLNSFFVGQGCDLDLFDPTKINFAPKILKSNKPIIGYVGALNSLRLNIELLEKIAVAKPEYDIYLVGPEDDHFMKSNLHKYSNIHFTGNKDIEELPLIINSFDVCINPQIVNEVTSGNYPRKIDEYLALGKPVVSTKTEAMDYFKDHTYLASDENQFIELIDYALLKSTEQHLIKDRIEFASSHSWENNVTMIWDHINSYNLKKAV